MANVTQKKDIVRANFLFLVAPGEVDHDQTKTDEAIKQYDLTNLTKPRNAKILSGPLLFADSLSRESVGRVVKFAQEGRSTTMALVDEPKDASRNKVSFQIIGKLGAELFKTKGNKKLSLAFASMLNSGVLDLGVIPKPPKKKKQVKMTTHVGRLLEDNEQLYLHSIKNEAQMYACISFVHNTINQYDKLKTAEFFTFFRLEDEDQGGETIVTTWVLGDDWQSKFEACQSNGKVYKAMNSDAMVKNFLGMFPDSTTSFVHKAIVPFDNLEIIVALPLRKKGTTVAPNRAKTAITAAERLETIRNDKTKPTEDRLLLNGATMQNCDTEKQNFAEQLCIEQMLCHSSFGNIPSMIEDAIRFEKDMAVAVGDDAAGKFAVAQVALGNRMNVLKELSTVMKKFEEAVEKGVVKKSKVDCFVPYTAVANFERRTEAVREIVQTVVKQVNTSPLHFNSTLDTNADKANDEKKLSGESPVQEEEDAMPGEEKLGGKSSAEEKGGTSE